VGPRPPGDERIVLPAAVEALGRARRWVALVAASLEEDRRTDAILIVSELLAVGLRRADPTVEWVTLSARVWPDRVRVTIHDAGWMAGRRTTDVADDGDDDTAILLAVKLADRLVFDAATGAVTFEIDAPGEGREP
jgi:anti-sigma regulatory factor (Ser/Thr protein kinase)